MSGALGLLTRFGLSEGRSEPPPPVGSPLVLSVTGTAQTGATLQLGWEFKVGATPLTATHFRINALTNATLTLRLWRVHDQTLLASEPAVSGPGGTWVEVPLSSPVTLEANTNYVITARGTSGNLYRTTLANLTVDTSRITRGQGRFALDNSFPSNLDGSYAYGIVDLIAG